MLPSKKEGHRLDFPAIVDKFRHMPHWGPTTALIQRPLGVKGRWRLEPLEPVSMEHFPKCLNCDNGQLLPLSDYGRDGATIQYKAWVCNNPGCGFNIRIDNGEVSLGRPLTTSTK